MKRTALPPHLRSEADEAREFREWLTANRVQFDEAPRHSPHHRARGNGIEKGRADFILAIHGEQYAVELKRHDGGTVSAEQAAWMWKFRERGGVTAICCGAEHAIWQTRRWARVEP